MSKLPRISGKDTVKKLQRLGFEVFDKSGSHVYLHKWQHDKWTVRITVPVHGKKILKLKTFKSILKQAEIDLDKFIKA